MYYFYFVKIPTTKKWGFYNVASTENNRKEIESELGQRVWSMFLSMVPYDKNVHTMKYMLRA